MPLVQSTMLEDCDIKQKRALAAKVTEACADIIGGKPTSVTVIMQTIGTDDQGSVGQTIQQKRDATADMS